jgi:hypothetical protein
MNTIGLVLCLVGICIHIFVKTKQKAEEIQNHQRLTTDERHRVEDLINESINEEETYFMTDKSSSSKSLSSHSFPLKKYLSKTPKMDTEACSLLEQHE